MQNEQVITTLPPGLLARVYAEVLAWSVPENETASPVLDLDRSETEKAAYSMPLEKTSDD